MGHLVVSSSITLCASIVSVVIFVVIFEWDPIHIFILGTNELLQIFSARFAQIFKSSAILKLLRFILSLLYAQAVMTSVRSAIIIGFTTGAFYISIQDTLMNNRVAKGSIALYYQLIVIRNVLRDYEKSAITCALTAGFGLVAVLIIVAQIGVYLRHPIIVAAALLLSGIVLLVVVLGLKICSSVNDKSLRLLDTWGREAGVKWNSGYWIRVIKSCKPLAVPAGEVGIVNRELEIHYFHSGLGYVVNILVTMKEFIEHI